VTFLKGGSAVGHLNPVGRFSWFDHAKFGGKVYREEEPTTRTTDPIVTGTSVLAIKYKDGIMLACDTLASYGSLARFRDLNRVKAFGKHTILGASGEYSDFQELSRLLDDMILEDDIQEDGNHLSPKAIHSYLARLLYQKRNKMDPYYNKLVIGGFYKGESFLGYVDFHGTNFTDKYLATGFGAHMAMPILRNEHRDDMTKEEAKQLLDKCLTVLFYRDARALNRYQVATVTAEGPFVSEPYELKTDWSLGNIIYPGVKNVAYSADNNNNATTIN
jgi:20S proteasome subunit beta 7